MTNVPWPNEASPGLSAFQLDAPDGWTAVESPGVLLALLGPETDGFRANIVVFGQRLPAEVSVDDVADQAVADGGERDAGDGTSRAGSDGRLPIAVRRSSEIAEGLAINHLVVATEADDRSPAGLRSVFTMVASFLASRLEQDEPAIKDTFASFTVGVPVG